MSTQKAARGGGRAAQRRAAQGAPPPVPSAPGAAPAAAAAASPNVIAAQAISLDSLNEMEQRQVNGVHSQRPALRVQSQSASPPNHAGAPACACPPPAAARTQLRALDVFAGAGGGHGARGRGTRTRPAPRCERDCRLHHLAWPGTRSTWAVGCIAVLSSACLPPWCRAKVSRAAQLPAPSTACPKASLTSAAPPPAASLMAPAASPCRPPSSTPFAAPAPRSSSERQRWCSRCHARAPTALCLALRSHCPARAGRSWPRGASAAPAVWSGTTCWAWPHWRWAR